MNVLDYLDKYWEKDLQYNENIWILYSYPENNSCEEWAFDSMKKIIEKTTNNNAGTVLEPNESKTRQFSPGPYNVLLYLSIYFLKAFLKK